MAVEFKKIDYDFIETWCFDNGKEAWLEGHIAAGTSFLVMKEAFVAEFMPTVKPPKKEKPLTMAQKFALRKAAAKK